MMLTDAIAPTERGRGIDGWRADLPHGAKLRKQNKLYLIQNNANNNFQN